MSRNNDRRNARRQNNGSWQRASSTNKVAAKATTMTGGEDPTQLTAVESFLRKGSSNRLSDTSSACSLGELQSWILIFERSLERCPSPGANDLYQCFVNGIPFNELTVKASIYERIVAELGTRAQEMEQSNVRAGDTSSVQQFAIARELQEQANEMFTALQKGGRKAALAQLAG